MLVTPWDSDPAAEKRFVNRLLSRLTFDAGRTYRSDRSVGHTLTTTPTYGSPKGLCDPQKELGFTRDPQNISSPSVTFNSFLKTSTAGRLPLASLNTPRVPIPRSILTIRFAVGFGIPARLTN